MEEDEVECDLVLFFKQLCLLGEMSTEAEEKEEIIASIPEGVYDQPIPVALTLPENLLIITLTLADHCRAIRQGLLPAALLAAGGGLPLGRDPAAAGPPPHGTRDCPLSRMLHPDGARLHPGPRGAPAVAGMSADRCLATPPGWYPAPHAHAHLPGPRTQRLGGRPPLPH
nr:translation initiation factor IF-2-like isoform X2 [Ovis aries]